MVTVSPPPDAPGPPPDDASALPTLPGSPPAGGSGAPLVTGALLGRYVVLGRLGAGGMGVVYAAYDPELDRKVAVKLLHHRDDVTPTDALRLVREAKAMARLTHPNVITVHDVGTIHDHLFVAMEFIDGPTLRGWCDRPGRPWRDVLAVYMQAGRGLAAAHAAGLVHRDFKPDNVLVGADGRARVLDFGLARAAADAPDARPALHPAPADAPAGPLTQDGAIVGTPAYMAPEQRIGAAVDARGDQFSFCASLWEALVGALPFAGRYGPSVLLAVRERRFVPVPKDIRVPRRVLRVLARGLAFEPHERFPDLDALLAALARAAASRRWLALVGAAALAAGLALALVRPPAPRCLGGADKVAAVWPGDAAEAVHAAFVATRLPYAETAWDAVDRGLRRHLDAWQAMYADACAATQIRGEQSPELMDRRMGCLAERLRETRALVEAFAAADVATVERSLSAVQALTDLGGCADVAELAEPALNLPREPGARAAVIDRRLALADLRAQLHAGRYVLALPPAEAQAAAAAALGFCPLQAEAELLRGALLCRNGRADDGAAALAEATWAATACRHDAVVVEATLELTYCVGVRAGRLAEATGWARHADAAVRRAGRERGPEGVRLLGYRSLLRSDAGQFEEARALAESAVAAAEALYGPDDFRLVSHLGYVGTALEHLGRYREALDFHLRALRIAEGALGPVHPLVAIQCNNLSVVHATLGDHARALAYQDRDLAISIAALGPDHPETALSHANRGALLSESGRHQEALPDFERAREIYDRVLPGDHPDRIALDNNHGSTLLELGRFAEARPRLEQALAMATRLYGPDHPDRAFTEEPLGTLLTRQGEFAAARPHLDAALALRERALGPDHTDVARALVSLAGWWTAQGQCDPAVPLLTRAGAIFAREFADDHPLRVLLAAALAHCQPGASESKRAALERAHALVRGGGFPHSLAAVALDLADVQWSQGQAEAARTLVFGAADALIGTGEGLAQGRARLAAWLVAHPPPGR